MPENTKKIEENKREKIDDCLGWIFNLSNFKVFYPEFPSETDILDEKRKGHEDEIYNEVVSGLESDLENLGMQVTYSSRIIIGEIAMNLLFIQRAKAHMICRGLLIEKRILKKDHVSSKKGHDFDGNQTTSKSDSYDYYPAHVESVHPILEKLIFQLQNQVNTGLKLLGLLPSQQIERQKLIIVKKLRQKCESLDREYTIKAEAQKNFRKDERNIKFS